MHNCMIINIHNDMVVNIHNESQEKERAEQLRRAVERASESETPNNE